MDHFVPFFPPRKAPKRQSNGGFTINSLSRCRISSKFIKRIYSYTNWYYGTFSVMFSVCSVSIKYPVRFCKNNTIINNITMLIKINKIYFETYNSVANILLLFFYIVLFLDILYCIQIRYSVLKNKVL